MNNRRTFCHWEPPYQTLRSFFNISMISATAAADNLAESFSSFEIGTHKDDVPPVPTDYRWSTQAVEVSPGDVSQMCPSAPVWIRAAGYDPSVTAYRPLSNRETRIIAVLKGEPHEPLKLRVYNVSLDDELKYVALSYTWRGQKRDVPVQLWSSPWTPHTILVTQSLIEAVVELRQKTCPVLLWVDQISINQADNIEKSSQVGLMGQIFRKASYIPVWLGGESEDSDLAIDRLNEITRIVYTSWFVNKQSAVIGIGGNTHRVRPDILKSCIGPNNGSNAKSWTAIANLVRRPWFARIWVIQEATALPSEQVVLNCGKRNMALSIVSRWLPLIIISWWELWKLDRTGLAPVKDALLWIENVRMFDGQLGSPNQPTQRLSHLLAATDDCEATDPRDKVFCMLQFASDVSRNDPDLRVDYSISMDEVCVNYVQWHVRMYHNLDFLGRCYRAQHLKRPMWLPDFSQTRRATFSPEPLSSQPEKVTADLDKTWVQACGTESNLSPSEYRPQLPRALVLSGVRVGKVCTKFELSMVLDPAWTSKMQSKTCSLNGTSMLECFLQAAKGGQQPDIVSIEAVNELQRMRCRPLGEWQLEPQVMYKMEEIFARHAKFRSLFYIGHPSDDAPHLVGLGPKYGPADAEIWMLKGGKTLYALAPGLNEHECKASVLDLTGECGPVKEFGLSDTIYAYLGECFMPGLMKGELLDLMKMEPKSRPAPLEDMDSDFKTIYLF